MSPVSGRFGGSLLAGRLGRLTAFTLLSLVMFFALTAAFDRCDGETDCEAVPCHFLCADGCATTPVPSLAVNAVPITHVRFLARPTRSLCPPSPALERTYRPPRLVA